MVHWTEKARRRPTGFRARRIAGMNELEKQDDRNRGDVGDEGSTHVASLSRQHGRRTGFCLLGLCVVDLWLRGGVDGMVGKVRVARESLATGRRIARNRIVTAMTLVQLTQKRISRMSIEYER